MRVIFARFFCYEAKMLKLLPLTFLLQYNFYGKHCQNVPVKILLVNIFKCEKTSYAVYHIA